MKKIIAEVIGPDPPCVNCTAVKRNVEAVAKKLADEGIEVEIERRNIISEEVIQKYGILFSPALAVNGVVKIMGKVPDVRVIERLIREAL